MTVDELNRVENKLHEIADQTFVAGLLTGMFLCFGIGLIIFILI